MSNKFTPKEAVCQYMGWNFDDANDYRYHYGMTSIPVYASSDLYVCALPNGKKVPMQTEEYITSGTGKFEEATGSSAEYCKSKGKTVWIFKVV